MLGEYSRECVRLGIIEAKQGTAASIAESARVKEIQGLLADLIAKLLRAALSQAEPAPTGEADKAEDTETICAAITKLLGVEDPRPFDLLNLVAAYAMRCEDDGRRHEKLYQRIKALEFQNGFMPDRRVGQPAGDVALRAEDVEDQLRRLARWFDGRPHIRGVFYGMAADEALSCLADNLSSRPPGGAAEWRNTSEQMPADRLPVLVDGGIAMWRDGVWYTGMEEPWFQRPIEWTVRRWAPITAALNRLSADPPGGESQ